MKRALKKMFPEKKRKKMFPGKWVGGLGGLCLEKDVFLSMDVIFVSDKDEVLLELLQSFPKKFHCPLT